MIAYPTHYPDAAPELADLYGPAALAALPPAKRAKRERHVEKMRELRERFHAAAVRRDELAAVGECYCDGEHRCAAHAAAWWAEYARRVAARPAGEG